MLPDQKKDRGGSFFDWSELNRKKMITLSYLKSSSFTILSEHETLS